MTITWVVWPRIRRRRSISPPRRSYSVANVCRNLWAWTRKPTRPRRRWKNRETQATLTGRPSRSTSSSSELLDGLVRLM